MRNYNDSSARDAAARLLSLVNRVTILREKEPSDALKLLAGAAECIINGDCMGAYIKHCALCRAAYKKPCAPRERQHIYGLSYPPCRGVRAFLCVKLCHRHAGRGAAYAFQERPERAWGAEHA